MKRVNDLNLFPHSIFTCAPTETSFQPFHNQGRTLRLALRTNLACKELSVRFSNACGETPVTIGACTLALCNHEGALQAETLVPVTVDGRMSFELAPRQTFTSDRIPFPLKAGYFFALNVYYPAEQKITSGNWIGRGATRSKPGNFSVDSIMPGPKIASRIARSVITTDMAVTITTLADVVAHCETKQRTLACFGDSITQQSNWTGPLTKLLAATYPGEISLCNLGISGNRLLHNSPEAEGGLYGIAGVSRFERDLLPVQGLTHAILAIGTNDIGLPGSHGLPENELISLSQYAAAMENMAGQLSQRGCRVYAATLTPRAIAKPYSEEREALRQQINNWIRTCPCFDAVLDFDAVLRREDGQPGMKEDCSLPDGLHPSPYGGLLLAKSIDLSLFGGGSHG